ncbi:MAG: hypothetical protein FJ303_26810 [Planctomycetes bacterium]|nr:hypothetical protein [Planctomycetota bacterium]
MRRLSAIVVIFSTILITSCGPGEPTRYPLQGKIIYDGQAIPFGDVVLTPDGAKGNSGPQGFANIRDGFYDTAADGGKGFAGGPTVIHVTGFTAQGGKLIVETDVHVDLPRDGGSHDINIPKKDAQPEKKKGSDI